MLDNEEDKGGQCIKYISAEQVLIYLCIYLFILLLSLLLQLVICVVKSVVSLVSQYCVC